MRMHGFAQAALARLADQKVTLQAWGSLLDELLDQMEAHRKLFLLDAGEQMSVVWCAMAHQTTDIFG